MIWVRTDRTYLQYDFAMHLSQLENVDGTDSRSDMLVLRTHNPAILAGLILRGILRSSALKPSKHSVNNTALCIRTFARPTGTQARFVHSSVRIVMCGCEDARDKYEFGP